MQEHDNRLQNKKLTVPEMDDVSYLMIKKLPFNFKLKLLHFYNKILNDEIPQPHGNNIIK